MKKKLLLICCLLAFLFSPASAFAQTTEYTVIITNVSWPDYQDGYIVYILGAVYQVTRIYEINDDGSQTPVNVDLGQIVVGPTGARFTTSIKGGYLFQQVKRAPGYLLIDEPFVIEFPQMLGGVVSPDQTVEIMQKAIPVIGDVELLKVDPNGRSLAGAIFELWQITAPGQDVTLPRQIGDRYITDANGYIRVKNLPEGRFEFREIQPPPGFAPNPTPLEFTIDPDFGLPIRIELRFENCPLSVTPTTTTTPGPTQQPTTTPGTQQPTTTPGTQQPTTTPGATQQPTTTPGTQQPTTTPGTQQPTTTPGATQQPTPSPTQQPTKPPTPRPTGSPINPPNTGELTEYIMLGIGAILLILFLIITLRERKTKREEN